MSAIPQYSAPNSPFVGPDGRLTFSANVFLRDLWLRAGGANAPSNDELSEYIDSARLGVFGKRDHPQEPTDIGYVRTFAMPSVPIAYDPQIQYIASFLPRVQEQPTQLADAQAVICSRVFRQR